jgi:4'-phosphopantetheinyl transferase
MNDIHLFYLSLSNGISDQCYDQWLSCLPATERVDLNRFKFRADRERRLLGRMLLRYGLIQRFKMQVSILNEIRYTNFKKPCIRDIRFSISHSADLVTCAVSDVFEVGVDVEKHALLTINDFRNSFTTTDWRLIENSNNPLKAFYDRWTIKEAVLKADGRGLLYAPQDIDIGNKGAIVVDGNTWYTQPVFLHREYSCYVASNHPSASIRIEQLDFQRLLEYDHQIA